MQGPLLTNIASVSAMNSLGPPLRDHIIDRKGRSHWRSMSSPAWEAVALPQGTWTSNAGFSPTLDYLAVSSELGPLVSAYSHTRMAMTYMSASQDA